MDEIENIISDHMILVLVIVIALLVLYAFAGRITHWMVRRTLEANAGEFEDGGVTAVELDKRARTLESLVATLIRSGVILGIAFLFIGFFGLWSVLTGMAIMLAALTLAGQSIVLDYMMGILIIVEGTFFEGDDISAGDPSWGISGTVEDVGLRRTTIRSPDGTVHSISNGDLRRVSNRTRIYSAAEVRVRGIREEDLDEVLGIMDRVGQEVAEDEAFSDYVMDAPAVRLVGDPDDLGWTATMRGKVMAARAGRSAARSVSV